MLPQYLIVAIVLVLAIAYAIRRIRKAVSHKDNPCDGCAGCAIRDIRRQAECKDYRNYRKH